MQPESGMPGTVPSGKPVNKHSRGRVIAVNLALLLLLLLLLEGGVRILRYPFNPQWEPTENAVARFDGELGWTYLPNLSKSVRFETYERMIYTDENGIRVPSPGFRLSPSAPSALFIGCSYTMGHGLSYEESFVGKFAGMAGNRMQAVNLGVQAYGTDQAYLSLTRFAPKFNTRVVVYTFMDEHVERNGNYDRRLLIPDARFIGTKPLFRLDRGGRPYLAKKPLPYGAYRHSWLFDALLMKVGPLLGVFPPYPEELTRALVGEMQRYCTERGIRFVLLNWRWNEFGYNRFGHLRGEAVDTLQQAPAGWEGMRIPGDNHPDEAASAHVAGILYDRIVK